MRLAIAPRKDLGSRGAMCGVLCNGTGRVVTPPTDQGTMDDLLQSVEESGVTPFYIQQCHRLLKFGFVYLEDARSAIEHNICWSSNALTDISKVSGMFFR